MRAGLGIMAAILIAAFLFGCDGPPIVPEPPPPLEGTYNGVYRYEKAGELVLEQHVKWIFTTNVVLMNLDTTVQPESERVFCDIEGRYAVDQGIDIYIPIIPGRDSTFFQNLTQKECNRDLGPFGRYQLDQSVKSRVVMTRNNAADTAFQRIIIDKISDEY
jgi:hypothetical protein